MGAVHTTTVAGGHLYIFQWPPSPLLVMSLVVSHVDLARRQFDGTKKEERTPLCVDGKALALLVDLLEKYCSVEDQLVGSSTRRDLCGMILRLLALNMSSVPAGWCCAVLCIRATRQRSTVDRVLQDLIRGLWYSKRCRRTLPACIDTPGELVEIKLSTLLPSTLNPAN